MGHGAFVKLVVLVKASAIGASFESVEFKLAVPFQERKLVDFVPIVDRSEEMDSVRVREPVGFSDFGIFECLVLGVIYWLQSRFRCRYRRRWG